MTLDEFVKWVTRVELSQHFTGETDLIGNPKNMVKLITIINQGLRELHSKFLIKKGVIMLELNPCCYRYVLEDKRPYLKAMDCPINLLKILEVVACDGRHVRLNATHRVKPCPKVMVEVFTPNYKTLEFNTDCGLFRINYRRHGMLIPEPTQVDRFRMDDYELDIPEMYIEALTYYVCMKVFAPIAPTVGEGVQNNPALIYSAKYKAECDALKETDVEEDGVGNYQQRFMETLLP